MRFIHMADVHLGCTPDGKTEWGSQRRREIWETFQESVHDAADMHADLVLIAGDLFHNPPDEQMLREVSYLFSSCPGVCFALIAGNHDCMTKESAWRRFHFPENVAVLGSDGCECITFTQFGCEVYGFSYDRPQIDKPLYDGLMPDENGAFHILLAHGGDALHIPYRTEEMERSGFDYIALGHIHKPQILLKDRAAYSGALSPIDAGDEGPHGYIVGETHGHSVHLQFVEKAKREYVTMTVTVDEEDTALSLRDEVASAIRKRGSDNIYKIVLRGQRRIGVHFDTELIAGCGMILSVSDQTTPALHLEMLRQTYKGQLIGRYIESFEQDAQRKYAAERQSAGSGISSSQTDASYDQRLLAGLSDVQRKALMAGLEALLVGRN